MATSKTLTPTNVTISIPAMTDQPNASVFANCVDKEADAINALNSKFVKKLDSFSLGSIPIGEDATVSAASVIPTGYKLGLAVPRYPGLDVCCFLLCTVASDTEVKVRIGKWGSGSYSTTTPSVQLLFIPA